eukprot:5468139-Pyramimonas_sp.AAC.1
MATPCQPLPLLDHPLGALHVHVRVCWRPEGVPRPNRRNRGAIAVELGAADVAPVAARVDRVEAR